MAREHWPIKHTLAVPIEVRNLQTGDVIDTVAELTMHWPKGRELRAMDGAKGEMGKTLALIGACCRLPPAQMDLMDPDDIAELSDFLEEPLGKFKASEPSETGSPK